MTSVEIFNQNYSKYEDWFLRHSKTYESEILAIKESIPSFDMAMEVGVGTGRFSSALGIRYGTDPSREMLLIAKKRGIEGLITIGELLPFRNECFDLILMVTTICFLDNPEKAMKEIHRILKHEGHLIVGFVDASSPIGKDYLEHRNESIFYQEARFFTAEEVIDMMKKTGFTDINSRQTLFHSLNEIEEIEPNIEGHGKGSFVVVRGRKI